MRQGLSVAICGLLLPILAGCTGTTVRPSNTQQTVPKTYTVAVVGEITANDELWHAYTVEARRQLISELNASQAFSQILDSAPPPGGRVPPPGARVLVDIRGTKQAARVAKPPFVRNGKSLIEIQ